MKKEQKDPLYVGIIDPVDVRRDILNSSKDVITSLKRFETVKAIRDEKELNVAALRKIMKELSLLSNRIMHLMPKATVSSARPVQKEEVQDEAPGKQNIVREKTRLAELEDELARVDEKLKSME